MYYAFVQLFVIIHADLTYRNIYIDQDLIWQTISNLKLDSSSLKVNHVEPGMTLAFEAVMRFVWATRRQDMVAIVFFHMSSSYGR